MIIQNLFWAVGYNMVMIPLAAAGIIALSVVTSSLLAAHVAGAGRTMITSLAVSTRARIKVALGGLDPAHWLDNTNG